MKYIARLYPNRELRVVRCPERIPRDSPSPGLSTPQIPAGGIPCGSEAEPEDEASEPEATPSPLTLHPNSKPGFKVGYGTMGRGTQFGVNARRSLLRCGGVFDLERIPPSQVAFLTGTLPGGTMDAMVAIAAWSSCLVNRLKAWISKYAKDTYSLYVWERQRRGALHLHYAVHIPCPVARHRILVGFKPWWVAALGRIGADADVDMFAWANGKGSWAGRPDVVQADAQECTKTISGYLAKYASKQEGKGGAHADCDGAVMPWPVRWWGCSRPLLAACRKYTEELVLEGASWRESKLKDEEIYSVFAKSFYSKKDRDNVEELGGGSDSVEDSGSSWHSYRDKAGSSRVWVGFGPQYREAWNMVVPILRKEKIYAEALDRNERAGMGELRQPPTADERRSHDNLSVVSASSGDAARGARKPARRGPCPFTLPVEFDARRNDGDVEPSPSGLRLALGPARLCPNHSGRASVGSGCSRSERLYLGVYWEVCRSTQACAVPAPFQYLEVERILRRARWTWCTMAASRH